MATCRAMPGMHPVEVWDLRADLAVDVLATDVALAERQAEAAAAAAAERREKAGRRRSMGRGAGEQVVEIHSAAELANFIPSARARAAAKADGKDGGGIAGGGGKTA